MKSLFKIFVLLFVFSLQVVLANSVSQDAYNKSTVYYEKQDYVNELKWLKKSFDEEKTKEVAFNLGLAYKNLKDYNNSIKWYKKAFEMGDLGGGLNTAQVYKSKFNDIPKAIKWYKKAIKKGHIDARKNLGLLYHQQKDSLNSATYMIGMIGHPYTKERVLGLLRDDWKIDEPTLKKAYELQKTLVPNPYKGGID